MDKGMKPMDKTPSPIRELIKIYSEKLDELQADMLTDRHKPMIEIRIIQIESFIKSLEQQLPTERQFAETCFDAGFNSCKCNWGEQEPTFDNFFKQYTHE